MKLRIQKSCSSIVEGLILLYLVGSGVPSTFSNRGVTMIAT